MKMFRYLALAACATALCACSSLSFDSPQDDLNSFQTALTTAETGYVALCVAEPTISVCTDAAQTQAKAAAKLVQDAITAAQQVITANGTDAQIAAALANVQTLESDFSTAFENAQAEGMRAQHVS